MGSPVKLYQREMHENLGFFPTWLPGDMLEIGDAGLLRDGRFRKMSSLKELNIPFTTAEGTSKQNVQYTSTTGTTLSPLIGASVPAIAKAAVSINFSTEGAFVFQATGVTHHQIENRGKLGEAIVLAYQKNQWKEEWVLIESLHTADVATIIVSQDRAAGIDLVANVDAPIVAMLADPKVELKVSRVSGKLVHVIGAQQIRPLYSCLKVKDSFFGGAKVQAVRGIGPRNEIPLTRPGINDLLDS